MKVIWGNSVLGRGVSQGEKARLHGALQRRGQWTRVGAAERARSCG